MNSTTNALRVAASIFGLVCLAQLARVLLHVEIAIGGLVVPLWPSGIAALVSGGLCVWLWKVSLRGKSGGSRS
jgi:hypothetical protein